MPRRSWTPGADKVSVNSAAIERPELIDELAEVFGAQCVVIAIDAKRRDPGVSSPTCERPEWSVFLNGGRVDTGLEAVEWAVEATERGAGEVLLTSMDRDGTNDGYELELTRAVADAVDVPVIASGGAGELSHLVGRDQRRPRRRRPLRLDLPLRRAHGRRGEGGAERGRDPGPARRTRLTATTSSCPSSLRRPSSSAAPPAGTGFSP